MRTAIGYAERLAKYFLRFIYRFERWHVTSLDQRKYATDIIQYANSRQNKNAAVEIGCGLGDIIRHLKYHKRYGMDISTDVLKAASFISKLTGQQIKFDKFQFPHDKLNGLFDLIIMVNWIHDIPPEILSKQIVTMFESHLAEGGEIIIDTVDFEGYPYCHNVQFLTKGLNCSLFSLGKYIRRREVWAIKKH